MTEEEPPHPPPPKKVRNKCVKGKSIPLQIRTGPVGSRRLRLPDFKIIGT